MEENKHILDIDIKEPTYIDDPEVRQNDDVYFVINITDDGEPYDLTSVSTITLAVKRNDKVVVISPGEKTDVNQVTFKLPKSSVATVGKSDATVQMYDAENRVSTFTFPFNVVKDPSGDGWVPSDGEKTLLQVVLGDGPLVIQQAEQAVDYIEDKKPLINKFTGDQTNLQAQVDQLVVDGESSPESAQARVGADAQTYPTLKARLDAEQNKVSSQLADKANQEELTKAVAPKADKTYVDSRLSDKASKTELENVLDGSPKDVYPTLIDLQNAYPTGAQGVYIVESDGHIYTWDGSAWVDRGLYQSQGVADGSIGTAKLAEGAGTRSKLSDTYNYAGVVAAGVDLNTIVKEGVYVVLSTALNLPSEIKTTALLIVHNMNGLYIRQEIYERYSVEKTFIRIVEPSNSYTSQWVKQINSNDLAQSLLNKSVGNAKLDDRYNYNGSHSNVAMSTLEREGLYVVSNATDKPISDTSGFLKISRYSDNIVQEYSSMIYPNAMKIYNRIKQVGGTFSEWFLVSNDPALGINKFKNESMVLFGDSITGGSNFYLQLAERLGINVKNCGFGGTRMTYHTDPDFDKFSFTKLVDAKISGDFTAQDDAASRLTVTNMQVNLQNLKDTDFSKVDILSIWFGTNDFSGSIYIGENGSEDTTTLKGALQYGIRRLLEAYPHLKIMVVTPLFRLFMDGDSDNTTNPYRELYLIDYADAIKEVAEMNHVPCLDMYRESGINRYNQEYYYSDGLHPYPEPGWRHVGNKIASFISANF